MADEKKRYLTVKDERSGKNIQVPEKPSFFDRVGEELKHSAGTLHNIDRLREATKVRRKLGL